MSSFRDRLQQQRPTPPVKKMKSFGFIGPGGSATWAMFQETATPVEVAEAIAREAGGQSWPLKIEGAPVETFDFNEAQDKIYDITWATSKDLNYYKGQLQKAVEKKRSGQKYQDASGGSEDEGDPLVTKFTEGRQAAVEAEFGQLVISCLDNMEETIDTLNAKKIELLKERARIEATIMALEEKIDGFKTKADEIVQLVDPFEQDVDKLAGGTGHQ